MSTIRFVSFEFMVTGAGWISDRAEEGLFFVRKLFDPFLLRRPGLLIGGWYRDENFSIRRVSGGQS